eukprot:758358-Hanusia_phi.AAC.4
MTKHRDDALRGDLPGSYRGPIVVLVGYAEVTTGMGGGCYLRGGDRNRTIGTNGQITPTPSIPGIPLSSTPITTTPPAKINPSGVPHPMDHITCITNTERKNVPAWRIRGMLGGQRMEEERRAAERVEETGAMN